jgi:hypothetical protein
MTHEDLVARLERGRISYPDDLPGERLTPITEERAAVNRAVLAEALKGTGMKNTHKALIAVIVTAIAHEVATDFVHELVNAAGVGCPCQRR